MPSPLVNTAGRPVANVHDVIGANSLLQREETDVYVDTGCRGADEPAGGEVAPIDLAGHSRCAGQEQDA